MPAEIPEQYRDLFDKKAFASLATIMPNHYCPVKSRIESAG